jgi:hypothetical protein
LDRPFELLNGQLLTISTLDNLEWQKGEAPFAHSNRVYSEFRGFLISVNRNSKGVASGRVDRRDDVEDVAIAAPGNLRFPAKNLIFPRPWFCHRNQRRHQVRQPSTADLMG